MININRLIDEKNLTLSELLDSEWGLLYNVTHIKKGESALNLALKMTVHFLQGQKFSEKELFEGRRRFKKMINYALTQDKEYQCRITNYIPLLLAQVIYHKTEGLKESVKDRVTYLEKKRIKIQKISEQGSRRLIQEIQKIAIKE